MCILDLQVCTNITIELVIQLDTQIKLPYLPECIQVGYISKVNVGVGMGYPPKLLLYCRVQGVIKEYILLEYP